MEEIAYDKILSAAPFRFLVGSDKREFFIHASLVANQSKMLNAMVNGSMKEAINGCTVWEHVTEDTFIRFGQYIYTGDYDGATPVKPESESKHFITYNYASDYNDWIRSVVEMKRGYDPLKRNEIHHAAPNNNNLLESKQVFLSHARLHAMADYYGITPLAQLALHKLHDILCKFALHEERICDVVALLQYCFEEEDERPLLRDLVSAFVAFHFKRLWKNVEFQRLWTTCQELVANVTEFLVERLSN